MIGTIERIVVALDAVSENRAAIDTAARLAARWKARLHAVFVEDDDLLRLAVLPFARQVTLGIGVEALTLRQARHQLHAFAERARRDVAAAARRHAVAWSFDVAAGATSGGVTVSTTDLVVAGTSTRPIGGHFRMECRWWSVVEPIPASYLLAHREWGAQGAVVALVRDREPAAERLVAAAAHLAESAAARLILICAPELAETEGFEAWLSDRLADHEVQVEIEVASLASAALAPRLAELDCWLLAIEGGAGEARPERLRDLVARIACDVLVVR